MIPKILHFCWFGTAPTPQIVKDCVGSWRKFMPDFTIMEWDDTTLPREAYARRALANRKFANVSNYMRFYALAHHGGIYLDTDIEVVRTFEPLLEDEMFVGWQGNGQINNAVMGAQPHHPVIQSCLEEMPKRFDGKESAHLSSPFYITDVLFKHLKIGKPQSNILVRGKGVNVYPCRYFYPYWHTEQLDRAKHVTPDTFCIHHWTASWKSK